jgi:hypothetical protein
MKPEETYEQGQDILEGIETQYLPAQDANKLLDRNR